MDCVAVGWLVWVVLLVGVVAGWLVCVVFAIGWQLWVAVWSIELLFWEGAVGLAVGGFGSVWLGI